MKSVTTHPTPQPVVDAIQVVAAWLRVIEAVEALVSPEGGAAFHGERLADRFLSGWGEAEAKLRQAERIIERSKRWAAHDQRLRELIREWEAS